MRTKIIGNDYAQIEGIYKERFMQVYRRYYTLLESNVANVQPMAMSVTSATFELTAASPVLGRIEKITSLIT